MSKLRTFLAASALATGVAITPASASPDSDTNTTSSNLDQLHTCLTETISSAATQEVGRITGYRFQDISANATFEEIEEKRKEFDRKLKNLTEIFQSRYEGTMAMQIFADVYGVDTSKCYPKSQGPD